MPVIKHDPIMHGGRIALQLAVRFSHAFRGKVHIMLKHDLALTALINRKANAKGEKKTNYPINHCHTFDIGRKSHHFKVEASLC